jgi:hypothetical protein
MAELLATYRDPAAARAAITTLERQGVDAADIHLLGAADAHRAKTDEAQNAPDMAVTREVATRSFTTAAVVAVIVGVIGALAGWFAAEDSAAVLMGGIGGVIVGGTLGFLWGGYSGIAVSEEWSDTFETEGPTTIAVHVADDGVVDLRDRIETTRPDSIAVS